jgi:hypothetical protein
VKYQEMKKKNKTKSSSDSDAMFRRMQARDANGYYGYSIVEYKPLSKSNLSNHDCDLSGTGFEDTLICQVVLWLHECEYHLYGDTVSQLENHNVKDFSSTVGFCPSKTLHAWKLCDGRRALSYKSRGPYVLLPTGVDVFTIQRKSRVELFLLRF